MAETYRDMTGRTYGADQVERVGNVTYVKGTSITVSPVSSGKSSSTTSSTTSSSKTSSSGSKSASSGTGTVNVPEGTRLYEQFVSPTGETYYIPKLTEYEINLYKDALQRAVSQGRPAPDITSVIDVHGAPQGATPSYYSLETAMFPTTRSTGYAVRTDALQQLQPQVNPEVQRLRDEIAMLRSQVATLQSHNQSLVDLVRQLQNVQPPQMPAQKTKVETVQENVPVEGVEPAQQAQQTTAQAEAPRGSSGFILQGGALPPSPAVSAEALYDYYRRLTGREDEGVRQFLAGPQFQAALQGAVPAWMAADPVWRALLARAGVNPRQLRLEALRSRLEEA